MFANTWQLEGPIDHSETVSISDGAAVPMILQVPKYSTMYWIYLTGVVGVSTVVSALPAILLNSSLAQIME